MPRSDPPLPLESRRRDDREDRRARAGGDRPYRISAVSAVAQVGLLLSVLTVPIYAALMFVPPAVPRLRAYEKFAAGFGFAAMAMLAVLCVAMMKRVGWSRRGMIAWSTAMLAWQAINLVIAEFVYAPARRQLLTTALSEQMATATQPTSRPAYFDAFAGYGIWLMPLLTFLALGGYALWSLRVMRGDQARATLG